LVPQLARRLGGLRVDEEAEIAGQGLKPVGLRVRCQEIDVVLVDIAQKPQNFVGTVGAERVETELAASLFDDHIGITEDAKVGRDGRSGYAGKVFRERTNWKFNVFAENLEN
jgi:hypothetical protein